MREEQNCLFALIALTLSLVSITLSELLMQRSTITKPKSWAKSNGSAYPTL